MIPDRTTRVLLVDNSPIFRCVFERVLSSQKNIRVVGVAATARRAREVIIAHRPHVIVMNVALPRVSGITFLRKLMDHYPVPVIICANSTGPEASHVIEALAIGAVEAVLKPANANRKTLEGIAAQLAGKIRQAVTLCPIPPEIPKSATAAPKSFRAAGLDPAQYLVAIGSSTGGPEALAALLESVPEDFPPTAIVQHIPKGFTKALADRLNRISRITVREAVDGERLHVGLALVGRAGVQMEVHRSGVGWSIRYGSTQLHNRHCPSVDVLFNSTAHSAGKRATGVILTGMGDDGAEGLLAMRNEGALTIGQNKESCVVYGMPKVAAEIGAVQRVGVPATIPRLLLNVLKRTSTRRPTARISNH